jgi:hypothetical protein
MLELADFRADFPEFSDTNQYSDASISFWLNISLELVNGTRWGELADLGVGLATAHQVVIANNDQATSSNGGTPGLVTGPVVSKAVDRVSKSMDTSAVTLTDAGFWNMTTYGIRFLQLARMFGAGPVQL